MSASHSRSSLPMVLIAVLLAAISGCGSLAANREPARTMTEAEHDTALARSSVPGAATVGRALDAVGQEAGHSVRMDSLTH